MNKLGLTYCFTYRTVTEESATHGDYASRGYADYNGQCVLDLQGDEEVTADDIAEYEYGIDDLDDLADAVREALYMGILARDERDDTQWWESEPTQSVRDGSYTHYGFHVEQGDASDDVYAAVRLLVNHLLS